VGKLASSGMDFREMNIDFDDYDPVGYDWMKQFTKRLPS